MPEKKKNLPAEETQEGIVNDSITGIQTENKRNLCTVRNVPASFIEICPCTGLFQLDQYHMGYMTALDNIFIVLILSLICCILPTE